MTYLPTVSGFFGFSNTLGVSGPQDLTGSAPHSRTLPHA